MANLRVANTSEPKQPREPVAVLICKDECMNVRAICIDNVSLEAKQEFFDTHREPYTCFKCGTTATIEYLRFVAYE